ncbi:ATP synthase F1 subunit delta [Crocinitomicaceae bacterium]|jgi:F-type H+-transporting ATPase subunit delta|nr:ATP synthase F1 subunit delta [Crocinitomicaceae bacterium]MDC0297010.1 ATP synthase F1 subunit delta [Crocinitomicaceae bacterium]
MKSTKSAIRYAKALLELSIENSNLNEVSSDMKRIVESSNETKDFKVFLNSPVIKSDKKIEILKVLFVGFEKLTSSFIDLITKNKREYLLVEIAEAYLYLLKKHQQIVPVSIKSARKLEKETLDQILNKMKSHVEGDFEVTEEVDESLIGGFIVRMDDKQIDASVLTQLNRMKQELAN